MSKYIINNSGSEKTYKGIPIADGASFQIAMDRWPAFASCEPLVADVGAGVVDISVDGSTSLSKANGLELLLEVYPVSKELTVTQQPPFAAKTIGDKSLFSRVAGKEFSLSVGSNDLLYTTPFAQMKFNGIEVINSEIGDKVDLYVLDDTSGTYSGTPSLTLNQFGYSVFLTEGYFERQSNYDADLYLGMQIKMVYTSITAKDLYVNYILHELK